MEIQEEYIEAPVVNFEDDYKLQDELLESVNNLVEIEETITTDGDVTLDIASEADSLLGGSTMMELRFSTYNKVARQRSALESIVTTIWETMKKIYEGFVHLVTKMRNFLFGEKRPTGAKIALSAADITKEIGELNANLKSSGALKLLDGPLPKEATEDMPVGIRQGSLFDSFVNSLVNDEPDFLTSGSRYVAVKNAIGDFTHAHFKNYVDGIRGDFTSWMDKMLREAKELRNYPNRTDDFRKDAVGTINTLREKYKHYVADIEAIDSKYLSVKPGPGATALTLFQNSPSRLTEHLDNLWKTIGFERIGPSDRDLAAALASLEKALNREIQILSSNRDEAATKGEESVFRLAIGFQKETIRHVAELVKLTNFIFNAAASGYSATTKAFSYLVRVFTIIGQADPSKKAIVSAGIEELVNRRKKLQKLIAAA